MSKNKLFKIIGITILVLTLPITLFLVKHQQDNRSHASAPDKLEAEGGIRNSLTTIKTDSLASGGNYIELGQYQISPAPTQSPSNITYTDYVMPTGIGWTDGSNAATNINNFISSKSNGTDSSHHTRIIFPAGFTYTGANGINLSGRQHLTIDGSGTQTAYGNTGGAIYHSTGNGNNVGNSSFLTSGANDIRIININGVGSNPYGGTNLSYTGQATCCGPLGEYQMGVAMYGGTNIEVAHSTFTNMQGDGLYMSDSSGGSGTWTDTIWWHNNTVNKNGRMGIVWIAAKNVTIEDSSWQDISMYVFDLEPNGTGQGAINTIIRRNIIGDYGWSTAFGNSAVLDTCCSSHAPFTFTNLTFDDNTINGVIKGAPLGHSPIFMQLYPPYQTGVWNIRNNKCTNKGSGPAIDITNSSANYTITNNSGCLSSGSFVNTGSGFSGTLTQSGNN